MEKRVLITESFVGLTRYYNASFKLADKGDVGYTFADAPSFERLIAEFGQLGGQLYDNVQQIAGVGTVRLSRYQLTVSIYPAFDWAEVEEAILETMGRIYGPFVLRKQGLLYRTALWLRRNLMVPLFKGIFR